MLGVHQFLHALLHFLAAPDPAAGGGAKSGMQFCATAACMLLILVAFPAWRAAMHAARPCAGVMKAPVVPKMTAGVRMHAGGWGVRALTGGLPPAVPLWSLRLALAYTDSGLGLAAARVAEQRAAERAHFPLLPLSLDGDGYCRRVCCMQDHLLLVSLKVSEAQILNDSFWRLCMSCHGIRLGKHAMA